MNKAPKYRIKVVQHRDGNKSFVVNKKVWWFPFWYNFNNVDACVTGWYDTEEEAREAIEDNKYKSIISYINL